MKVNELRIGNLILIAYAGIEGKEWRVYPTKTSDIIDIEWHPDDYRPIPLTKEWLVKLGFEKINHINGYSFYTLSKSKKNKCHIDIYDNSTRYMGYIVNNCKYVHQLQNLYFALTGEELTIKE